MTVKVEAQFYTETVRKAYEEVNFIKFPVGR